MNPDDFGGMYFISKSTSLQDKEIASSAPYLTQEFKHRVHPLPPLKILQIPALFYSFHSSTARNAT